MRADVAGLRFLVVFRGLAHDTYLTPRPVRHDLSTQSHSASFIASRKHIHVHVILS